MERRRKGLFLTGFTGFMLIILGTWSGVRAEPPTPPTRTLYVNGATGVDASDCGTSGKPCKTIQYTINKAPDHTRIRVAAGTYNENLLVERKSVWFSGAGSASTFLVGTDTAPVVHLFKVLSSISGFTIKGGEVGIRCELSDLLCEKNIIEYNQEGIDANTKSAFQLKNVTVRNNSGTGVDIDNNTVFNLDTCTVSNNGGPGVVVEANSSGELEKCNVKNNKAEGIRVVGNSTVNLNSVQISGNSKTGLSLQTLAAVTLEGGNVISGNGKGTGCTEWCAAGVSITFNSHLSAHMPGAGLNPDKISANAGDGLWLHGLSGVIMMAGEVSQNGGDGVQVAGQSRADLPSGVNVVSNNGFGIRCQGGSYNGGAYLGSAANGDANKLGTTSSCY